jgi:hypothetical protein
MPDTMRRDFPDKPCSDCGDIEKGLVYLKHWGPLVPTGETGYFGPVCFEARQRESHAGFDPRPLGTRPLTDGEMEYIKWAKDTHKTLPTFGTPEFETGYTNWCSMGMLRDPFG